jgi:hypothetical protein
VADRGVGGALRRAAMAPVLAATDGTTGSPGIGTLFLALLVGLAAVGVLVLLLSVRNRQHGPGPFTALADLARLSATALRERGASDDARRLPRAELDRRFSVARHDLRAAVSGGLGSRALAELAAYDERDARIAEVGRAAALEKALVAKSRAAERRSRAAEQAELFAAERRLRLERSALSSPEASATGRGAARGPAVDPSAEAALTSALLEATRLLAAQQVAVEAATERRVAAERAADEAATRVRQEKEAAAAAHQARAAAERAAAKAKAEADRERRTAGKASSARVEAEAAARRASEHAAKERAAAKEAAARRQAAVKEVARAEAAQRDATTRELTALRAAEAAEASRRAVVASFEERQAAVAAGPPDEIDLRAVTEPARRAETRAVAATEARPRRLQVVRRTQDNETGSSPPPQDPPAVAAAPEPEPADVRGTEEPPPSPASPAAPKPRQVAEARITAPARIPGSVGWKVLVVRLVAALMVPAVVALRTVAQGSWWTDAGPVGWSMLALAVLLTGLGLGWLWAATREPYALLPRTRRAVAEAELRHQARVAAAGALLAELRTGGPSTEETWARFEAQTGLTVPSATRTVIDPEMDPGALVRHLAARQRQGRGGAQSLGVVTLVPLLTCLVPAMVLLLLV